MSPAVRPNRMLSDVRRASNLVSLDTPGLGVPARLILSHFWLALSTSSQNSMFPFRCQHCPLGKAAGSALTGALFLRALRVTNAYRSLPTARRPHMASPGENLACRIGGRHPYGIYFGAADATSRGSAQGPESVRGPEIGQNGQNGEKARFWGGGPNLKTFGGPPMTARTPAGSFCIHRSLTVVYRGGPRGPLFGGGPKTGP